MSIDRLGNELEGLGVSGHDIRCLLLLPQIYVGWACRERDVPALEALLDTTARGAHFSADSVDLARSWLFGPPTRAQFQSGFALLRALRRAPENPLILSSDLLQAMLWASRAALLDRAPTTGSGSVGSVTLPVREALSDLEEWLEIETGDLLSDLLSDLGVDTPRRLSVTTQSFEALSEIELEDGTALLELVASEEHSGVLVRQDDDVAGPESSPFPLVRKVGSLR